MEWIHCANFWQVHSERKKKNRNNNQKRSAGEDSCVCLLCEWEFNYSCQVTVHHKSGVCGPGLLVYVTGKWSRSLKGNSSQTALFSEVEILMAQRREFFADFFYRKALFLRQFFSALLLWTLIYEDMRPIEALEHVWASSILVLTCCYIML